MTRRSTVLLGLLMSVVLGAISRTTWSTASAMDLSGSSRDLSVLGADAAPAVVALAIVGVVASLAASLSSVWIRFVTGPVLVLVGMGAGAVSLTAAADPASAARPAISASVGVVGGAASVQGTAWPYAALVPALGLVLVGVLILVRGGRWPRSSKYSRAQDSATRGPQELDPQGDPAGAWDALTLGEDPTAGTRTDR